MKTQHSVVIALAFFAIYIIWGTTYLAIIFGLKSFPPFILSSFRFLSAGILLFLWCKAKGERTPAKNIVKVCAVSGCFMLIGGSGLVTWGEKYVSSGQTAIIVATEPFLFNLFDKKKWPDYFSNKLIISGLIIGFLGLFLFFRSTIKHAESAPDNMFIIANIVLFASAMLWVTGSLYAKTRLASNDSNLITSSLQLIAAGIGSAVIATFRTEWSNFAIADVALTAWAGLIYLIIFGSLAAYIAFTWLISIRPPALVSTHTYINPVVAVILGWLIADERISVLQIAALGIILTGMLLTNLPGYNMPGKEH